MLLPQVWRRFMIQQHRPTRPSFFSSLILLLLAWFVPPAASAQALGAITGVVTDATGAAVPRATVTATEVGTGFERTIFSDEAGRYTLPSLRPTEYSLTVEGPGFRKFVLKNIPLIPDQTATVPIRLEV